MQCDNSNMISFETIDLYLQETNIKSNIISINFNKYIFSKQQTQFKQTELRVNTYEYIM